MRKFSSMYTEHGRSSRAHGSVAIARARRGKAALATGRRAPDASSGRPAERPPPAERRDRPVRHAPQGLLERPRDAEEFGIV